MKVITLGSIVGRLVCVVGRSNGTGAILRGTAMIERPKIEAIDIPASDQVIVRLSPLSMTWSVDPATGKPVARWVAALPELTANHSVAAAA